MIRAAIVGIGTWGRNLVTSVQGSEDIRFVAGATQTPAKAADFCRQHGIRLVESYERLLGAREVDAVVLATPVCRGSRTGVLKNLLDDVPVTVLERTPAGITAMRATQHHYLGAERHLRDVLAFFGALVAPVAVYLTGAEFDDGRPIGAADRDLNALLAKMVGLARAVGCRSHDGPQPLAAGGARR